MSCMTVWDVFHVLLGCTSIFIQKKLLKTFFKPRFFAALRAIITD